MPRRLCGFLALTLAVLSAAVPSAAQNDERILRFHCDATVQTDGTLQVEETIRVRARGIEIRRGIYRDFPTRYRDAEGRPVKVGFEILEVRRDGQPENHRSEPRDNGVRIYLGRPDYKLPDGDYTYTLVYRTTRQLGFFEDHDELYWNVTGNGWGFPIDEASATVRLPAGVARDTIKTEAYTGPQGARDRNFGAEVGPDGAAQFRTTAPLRPREGLTIVVGWPKGHVTPPLEERILSFHSDLTVGEDGSVRVRESIRARAGGEQTREGIHRELPALYTHWWGLRRRVSFEVLEVLRDGQPEPFRVQDVGYDLHIDIGHEDRPLPPGEYTYTLAYRSTRQVGFLQDRDELRWNVTGNGWAFPIDQASATVRLPAGIAPEGIQVEAFTGPGSGTHKNYDAEVDAEGAAHIRTTAPLAGGEGLTLVVGWPKGFVAEPTLAMRGAYFLEDNLPFVLGLGGLALLVLYYLIAWMKVGRDPARGSIVTLYEPPEGYSPAALRYVTRRGFDDKTFTASVLDMAVKGYLTIREEKGVYTLSRTGGDWGPLSSEEKRIADALFTSGKSVELKQENHTRLRSAIEALKAALKLRLEKHYFLTNRRYLIPGLLLSVLVLVAAAGGLGLAMVDFVALFLGACVMFWTLCLVALLLFVGHLWRKALSARSPAGTLAAGMVSLMVGVPFLGIEIVGLLVLAVWSPLLMVLSLGVVAVNLLFYFLLQAPTRAGRALLDKVEGFKEFLTAVEGDRLQRMSPEITPQLFEKYLPYAVALNVEQAWAEKFSRAMAAAGQAPPGTDGGYSPSWYSGDDWSQLGATGFASSMGDSFSGVISSASTAPGSSSGFSDGGSDFGGGSSGGGGGGGGGGGW